MITPEARTTLDKDAVLADCAGRWLAFYGGYTELKRQGSEWRGPCPLHGGNGPNFAVNAETGLWHCFTGCQDAGGDALAFLQRKDGLTFPEALHALAEWAGTTPLPARNGHSNRQEHKNGQSPRRIAETYDYTNEAGEMLFQAVRYDPKGFAQRVPAGSPGTWTYALNGTRRVLYHLPEVVAAVEAERPVYLCEGEKDADALRTLGLTATCNPMGAGKWEDAYTDALAGAVVALLPDNDPAGRAHAARVAAALHGKAKRLRVVELSGLPDKGDVSDWLAAGGTKEALLALVKAAPDWTPESMSPASLGKPDAAQEEQTESEQQAEEVWDAPLPFTQHHLPVFPIEALPPALAGYVSEVAQTTQVPVDMPAMLGLAVAGAAGGRRCIVQVGETHSEPLNLFCAVIMEPGSRKSAIMEMTSPLREHEAELIRNASPTISAAKEKRAVEEKRVLHLREMAGKEKDSTKRGGFVQELQDTAADLTDVPALPRLLVDDVTPERLGGMMAENAGTMSLLSAEGGIFGILAGRYSGKGEANLDVFLKGHAGDELRVDRQAHQQTDKQASKAVIIKNPALTVGLLVQPDVLASLSDNPTFRGRGLLGRFLYALPESLAGTRFYRNRPIDPVARAKYAHALKYVLDLPDAGTEEDPTKRHVLTLTGEALTLWAKYADAVEARQAEGEDLVGIRDWASKLAGAVARIAGNFHLIQHAGGNWRQPLAPETALAAWAVGEYLIPHALAAFGEMRADPRLVLARRILGWIERKDLTQFTLRECQQAHKGGQALLTTEELLPALALLTEHGYVRAAGSGQATGGRPGSATYTVNPGAHNANANM